MRSLYSVPENLLIFKTNIQSRQQIKVVNSLFSNHQSISDWWVDIEDIDKVMRVELTSNIHENEIVRLIREIGLQCEPLLD